MTCIVEIRASFRVLDLMIDIGDRIAEIQNRIRHVASQNETQYALPKLIAVSKKQPIEAVLAATSMGQLAFGENYLQDALPKVVSINDPALAWHFIGPVQSNKCRDIATYFDWVHSVDRPKIAHRLSDMVATVRDPNKPPLKVLLQVNVDQDKDKAGIKPEEVGTMARAVEDLPNIELRGLMTILRAGTEAEQQRHSFSMLREIRDAVKIDIGLGDQFSELSMGMSGDWPQAVLEGSTMLRIGTAIFGERE